MKTILTFENEELSCLSNARTMEKIRSLCPDDLVILISAGDFSSSGLLLEPSCRERAEQYVQAGADLVLSLPVSSVLGGYGKKEFAGAALSQNLHAEDLRIMIPCVPAPGTTPKDCEKSLRSCAMLMFGEGSGYRGRLSGHLAEMSFRTAQTQTVCECMPQAEELLSCPENRQALWLLDAMLQLYYMPKTEFFAATECRESAGCAAENASESADARNKASRADHFEKAAAARTAALLDRYNLEQLIDISGSTTQMAEDLMKKSAAVRAAGSFAQITDLLLPAPSDRARLFLLKAILGLRKIHMQICGLHTYVPYCYVSAKDPSRQDLLKHLKEGSWVPFVEGQVPEQKVAQAYGYLLEADRKAQELIEDPNS